MQHLVSHSGAGHLAVGDKEISVNYVIRVQDGLGLRSAQGYLTGELESLLAAPSGKHLKLTLKNGAVIDVAIRNLDPLKGKADFLVSGSV